MTNIYVGNLSYHMTDDMLRDSFAPFGEVTSARIITDRDTGRSKGFGFVEMPDDAQAQEAISKLDGTDSEYATTWTLDTSAYATYFRTLWLPWETYGDAVLLGFAGTAGDAMTVRVDAKRIRGLM